MKRMIVAVVAALGVTLAGCSCTPNNQYAQRPYDQGYSQVQPAPVVVQQRDSSFLDRHGDAVLAAGAAYMAGKASARREDRRYQRRYYSRPKVYYSRPAPYVPRSYGAPRRSSSFGGYRSRR